MKKLIIISIITFILLSGCSDQVNSTPTSKTAFALDTVITITIYDKDSEQLIDLCFDEVKRLENLFSNTIVGSDIYNINHSKAFSEIKVSPETIEIIKKSIYYSQLSNGAFDINATIPSQANIKAALTTIDFNNIIIKQNTNDIYLKQKEMSLDLGGIAKGYIADKLCDLLLQNGCKSAIINLGGNVLTVGEKPDKSLYKIGIQNPNAPIGEYLAIVKVKAKSIVTSGIYERYFIKDGIRYHHILNPFTGYPYESDIAGITIISNKSVDGDALSTICFTLGTRKALAFIETIKDTEAIVVDIDGNIVKSSGIGTDIIFSKIN